MPCINVSPSAYSFFPVSVFSSVIISAVQYQSAMNNKGDHNYCVPEFSILLTTHISL
jgi:hypothetical protein